jgi:hypothetical protein
MPAGGTRRNEENPCATRTPRVLSDMERCPRKRLFLYSCAACSVSLGTMIAGFRVISSAIIIWPFLKRVALKLRRRAFTRAGTK